MKTLVKNVSGETIGQLLETGSRILAQDRSGKTLGWFEKNSNKTFDKSGSPKYIGDMTRALIAEQSGN
jgi:hypothetical protein